MNKTKKVLIMRKISYFLLFMLFFFGCGNDGENDENALKDLVKDEVVEGEFEKITWWKDGKEMVLIPAGSFEMGDHFSEGDEDELPVHTVTLDAFYMDIHEVTMGQFKRFVNQSGYDYPGDLDYVAKYSPDDDYPMFQVNWYDAVAYAEWAGKRLPTEAEWEYAARGGLVGKRFTWGDDERLARDYANYYGTGGKDQWEYHAPVGSFEPNGYGLYNMAGNLLEWCQDGYDSNYYKNSPSNNPQGPDVQLEMYGGVRVLRGGCCLDNANGLRLADRILGEPNSRYGPIGFRCVSGSD